MQRHSAQFKFRDGSPLSGEASSRVRLSAGHSPDIEDTQCPGKGVALQLARFLKVRRVRRKAAKIIVVVHPSRRAGQTSPLMIRLVSLAGLPSHRRVWVRSSM